MGMKIFLNVSDGGECRVALVENNKLQEYFVHRPSLLIHVGDIFRGEVSNTEPGIQAAFIDIGFKKNAFLHVSDVISAYKPGVQLTDIYGTKPVKVTPVEEIDFAAVSAEIDARGDEEDDDEDDEEEERDEITEGRSAASDRVQVIAPMPEGSGAGAEPATGAESEVEGRGEQVAPFRASAVEQAIQETVALERTSQQSQDGQDESRRRRRRRGRRGGRRRSGNGGEHQAAGAMPHPPRSAEDMKRSVRPPEAPPRRDNASEQGGAAGRSAETSPPSDAVPTPQPPRKTAPTPERAVDGDTPARRGRAKKATTRRTPAKKDGAATTRTKPDSDGPVSSEATDKASTRKTTRKRAPATRRAPTSRNPRNASLSTANDLPSPSGAPIERTSPFGGAPSVGGGPDSSGLDDPLSDGDKPPFDGGAGARFRRPARFRRDMPLPKIQHMTQRGQEVLVQVIKASQGGKGASVTTYISLPGRYMVLMPNTSKCGVSRKIQDEGVRRELRRSLRCLRIPEGMGVIIRTAAAGRPMEELQRDLNYLLRIWNTILEDINIGKRAPVCSYRDSDPALRTARDYFTRDVEEIVVDDAATHTRLLAFFDDLMPDYRDRVKLYQGKAPIFAAHGIEPQVSLIFEKRVPLPSGGYLFIEQTEALVAVDVNSGRFTSESNAEGTAYKTNMEAVPEIVRQLRMRDLGGIIVLDFIDMLDARHRRDVEERLRAALLKDRARVKIAPISPFGLIELTRQRIRPSFRLYTHQECKVCGATGFVVNAETQALNLLRLIRQILASDDAHGAIIQAPPEVLSHLHSYMRDDIRRLETATEKPITFEWDPSLGPQETRLFYLNYRGDRTSYDHVGELLRYQRQLPHQTGPREARQAGPRDSRQPREEGRRRRRRGGRGRGDGNGQRPPAQEPRTNRDQAATAGKSEAGIGRPVPDDTKRGETAPGRDEGKKPTMPRPEESISAAKASAPDGDAKGTRRVTRKKTARRTTAKTGAAASVDTAKKPSRKPTRRGGRGRGTAKPKSAGDAQSTGEG